MRAIFRPVDTITDAVLSFSFGTASGDIWLDDVRILDMTDALVPNSDHATLIFNDDFDEAALDRNKWNQLIPCAGVTCYNPNDLGYPAWHNIVQMGDGFLRLRAQREVTTVTNPPGSPEGAYTFSYTTGVVSSWRNFDFHYGYVEVRAKLPGGKGVWPAIWTNCYFELTQPTCWPTGGEIDIVELYGDQPNVHEHSIHYIGITNGKSCSTLPGHQCDSITVPAGDMTNDFHVYVVDWRVDRVIWYVDGVEVFHSTHSPAAINYVVLDVKLNGIGGHILPDETTPLPAEMVVDYVRVWRWK